MSPGERAVGPAGPFGAMHCSCSDALLIRRPLVRCIFESYGLRTQDHGTSSPWSNNLGLGPATRRRQPPQAHEDATDAWTRRGGDKRAGRPQPCGPRKTTVAYAHAHRSQSGWGGPDEGSLLVGDPKQLPVPFFHASMKMKWTAHQASSMHPIISWSIVCVRPLHCHNQRHVRDQKKRIAMRAQIIAEARTKQEDDVHGQQYYRVTANAMQRNAMQCTEMPHDRVGWHVASRGKCRVGTTEFF